MEVDLASLKSDLDKLDIDQLKTVLVDVTLHMVNWLEKLMVFRLMILENQWKSKLWHKKSWNWKGNS